MASDLNKVTLIGRLGKDPEVRVIQSGAKVCNLSLATSESWKDKTGVTQEKTEWHCVTIWGDGLVAAIGKYLAKGSKVYLEGKIQTRKWQDQSGSNRYSTDIVVQGSGGRVIFLDSASGNGASRGRKENAGGNRSAYDGPTGARAFDDLNDSIPF